MGEREGTKRQAKRNKSNSKTRIYSGLPLLLFSHQKWTHEYTSFIVIRNKIKEEEEDDEEKRWRIRKKMK